MSYKLVLETKPRGSLVSIAMAEMQEIEQQGTDCWLYRVNRIEELLKTPKSYSRTSFGKIISTSLKGSFDRFWLGQTNVIKLGQTVGPDHNKLRIYKILKGSFSPEPYLSLVRNRNQRCHITRMRVSAHLLAVERLRYSQPL